MKNPLRVGYSPLSDTIMAGRFAKDGMSWSGEKCDVTNDVLRCTVQKAMRNENRLTVQGDDGATFVLTLTMIPARDTEPSLEAASG